jgi:hypothetical protein
VPASELAPGDLTSLPGRHRAVLWIQSENDGQKDAVLRPSHCFDGIAERVEQAPDRIFVTSGLATFPHMRQIEQRRDVRRPGRRLSAVHETDESAERVADLRGGHGEQAITA